MNRRRRKKFQRRLLLAASWGTAREVADLLRAGADPDLRADHGIGYSAVDWARSHGHHETLELLEAARTRAVL